MATPALRVLIIFLAALAGYGAAQLDLHRLSAGLGLPDHAAHDAGTVNDTHSAGSHSGSGDEIAQHKTVVMGGEALKTETAAPPARKILYYRNPMGLADTSPVPKKDWMGMDYIAVYEGDEPDAGKSITIPLAKVQNAGVRTEKAQMVKLMHTVRAPGIVKPNERTLRTISLRADGFIEKLYANEHGLHVKAGEPLFRVYSQEMLRALADYRLEARDPNADPRRSVLSARQKLENLEVPPEAVADARRDKELPMAFDWPSPVTGVIMEKKAIEGMMAKAGEELFLIGDLSDVWVIADVAEHDIDKVKIGAPARLTFHALPGETFDGKVTFILHELDHGARTGKVRIEVANPDHRIRHEMYADVDISPPAGEEARLTVPSSAMIDSGERQVVLVSLGGGRFEPRDVKPGARGEGRIEIKEGLKEGEDVVVNGNFLIDAEANLQSALSAFTAGAKTPDGAEKPEIAP